MIGIVFISGFWFVSQNREVVTTESQNDSTNAENLLAQSESYYQDSDNDGLSDWEELLFGADPHNPDSNGNGILDGEEFATEKNYVEINPQEIGNPFSNYSGSAQGGNFFVEGSSNFTDTLTREAAYRYSFTDQAGGVDEETKAQLVNTLAADLNLSPPPDQYNEKDLTIINNMNTEIVNGYVTQIVVAFAQYSDIHEKDPLEFAEQLLDTQNETVMDSLSTLKTTYQKLSETILSLAVPIDLVPLHLGLVNNLYHAAETIEGIGKAALDPVKGMLATARYLHYRTERQRAFADLVGYFNHYNQPSEENLVGTR